MNENLVVQDVNIIINEYDAMITKLIKENVLLKSYAKEIQRENKRLEEELKLFKK